jgi:uncharacterized protein
MGWLIKWLPLFLSTIILNVSFSAQAKTPHFEKKKISIGTVTLEVEVAESPEQHSYGLMNRTKLPNNSGMLFVFDSEEPRFFWMKNTFIDLSIGYFDKNKVLTQIIDMKATNLMDKEFPSYPSKAPAQFALEVPKGWFKKHGIKIGDKFK